MLCGRRALKDYQQKEESVKAIMGSLSAKEELISEAVERVKEECTQLKSELAETRYQILEAQAEKIPEGQKKVCIFDSKLSGNEPRELMNLVLKKGTEVCAVFAGNEESGYRYVIGSETEDVRPYSKILKEQFDGRGGGKPVMVQGSVNGSEEAIRKVFE